MKHFGILFNVVTILLFINITDSYSQKRDFVITDFGAIPDGITNNAEAIQKAIDEANKNGGGKVIIPHGNFSSGLIKIKSNVEFYLEAGARLLGSVDIKDYGDPDAEGHALVQALIRKYFHNR
jgi:polygalacturonase